MSLGVISFTKSFFETIWVNTSGTINNSILDTEEFDSGYGNFSYMCNVDSDTIALTYMSTSTTGEYTLMTYNISSSGVITDTPANTWVFETGPYVLNAANICKVGSTIYDITYINNVADVYTKTVNIADTGTITKSWIDTLLVYASADTYWLSTFVVMDAQTAVDGRGVLGCTVSGGTGYDYDGWMFTWNVTDAGTLDAAIIDSLEFDAADNIYYAPVVWVNQSWYLIVYTGTGSDGWSCTVNILTNWAEPVFSAESPTNESVGQSITPECAITVADQNGDILAVTFASNYTGSWVNYQTNSSVGKVRIVTGKQIGRAHV